ncbi:MAG: endonuclease/exonuclease/phosphatase family protein, partial [Promethearchaeota archaeon]
MDSIKVATFNAENLFARFQFRRNIKDLDKILYEGFTVNHVYFRIYNEREKAITGEATKAVDADVIALQEVENLDTLRKFRTDFLGGRKSYPYAVVIDGNDPRRIDVAILSRYPLTNIQTHAHLWSSELRSYLFSRDCLVADVQGPADFTFTLFVNHFKSMMDSRDPENGRRNTSERRAAQAQAVRQIVTARFGENAGGHPFIILGDFNDYMLTDEQGEPGISDLVGWDQVVNVVDRLPEEDRWPHYFKGRGALGPAYRQLDYLLLSRSLAERNPHGPYMERRGLPRRVAKYTGERFRG